MSSSVQKVTRCSTRSVYLTTLFIIWCGANSLYAADAHKLLFKERSSWLFVDLTVLQSLTGALCALFVVSKPFQSLRNVFVLPKTKKSSIQIGACHFVGTLFTNVSFCLIGATSTLVWKLAEPFLTVVLKYIILKERVSAIRVTGVCTIVSGVFIFSNVSFRKTLIVSPILLANLAFPLRNVLVKAHQKDQAESSNTTHNIDPAFGMYVYSFPFALLGALMKSIVLSKPVFHQLPRLIRNSTYFSTYQIASILLLSKLDALTHAVANLVKRFCTISITAILLGVVFSVRHLAGLTLTGIGLIVYGVGDRLFASRTGSEKHKQNYRWRYLPIAPFVPVFAYFVMFRTIEAPKVSFLETADRLSTSRTLPNKKLFAADEIPRTFKDIPEIPIEKAQLVIRRSSRYEPSYEYMDNTGNWVWMYGGNVAIPDFSESKLCKDLRSCRKQISRNRKLLHYSPMANMFHYKHPTFFEHQIEHVEKFDDRILIIGIGAQQGFFQNITKYTLGNGAEIDTSPDGFEFTPRALSFLKIMQEKKMPMTFRGDFTWRAANRVGYKYGISLGCPSLMIHPDPYLGETLAAKYANLKSRIGDKSLKIALNVVFKSNFEFFKRILKEYPNSVIYAQSRREAEILYAQMGVAMNRIRIFGNVEDWRNSLELMDLSIGVRIHGNMIALAAGIPVFVIAPDHRVLELVERMFVPHTIGTDERLSSEFDVAELVSSAKFNPADFDLNRCRTAQTYKSLFSRYSIKVTEQINTIASVCANVE